MWPTIYISLPYLGLRFHISSAKQQSWQLSMDIHLQASSARICQAYIYIATNSRAILYHLHKLLCHNTFFTKQPLTNTFPHTLSIKTAVPYMNYFTNLSPLGGARCCYHSCERSTYLVLHLRNIHAGNPLIHLPWHHTFEAVYIHGHHPVVSVVVETPYPSSPFRKTRLPHFQFVWE